MVVVVVTEASGVVFPRETRGLSVFLVRFVPRTAVLVHLFVALSPHLAQLIPARCAVC